MKKIYELAQSTTTRIYNKESWHINIIIVLIYRVFRQYSNISVGNYTSVA